MVRVYVCLPQEIIVSRDRADPFGRNRRIIGVPYFEFLNSFNYSCHTLFSKYEKTDRFLDTTKFGLNYCIDIPKKGVKKIIESSKCQDYFSDNTKNDMMAIKYHGGYTIVSPEKFVGIEHDGNQEKKITVDRAKFVVWLKEEELIPFLREYNDLIKNAKSDFFSHTDKVKRDDFIGDLLYDIKKISPLLIGAIIIIILFQMCK